MKKYNNIYLYHLDAEVQKMYIRQNRYDDQKIKESFLNIVKIAFLLCESHLFVPFSNYLESAVAYDCLNYFANMEISLNPIVLLSTSPNLEMALNKKRGEHDENFNNPDYRYNHFLNGCLELPGVFRQRQNSASHDIENSFVESIGSDIWIPFRNKMNTKMTDFDKNERFKAVPELLGGKAYISDYVTPLLIDTEDAYAYSDANKTMNILITRWYLQSYLKELNAVCLKDIPYINSNELLPVEEQTKYPSYREIVGKLNSLPYSQKKNMSIMQYIGRCSLDDLTIFKYSTEWENLLEKETKMENSCGDMFENVGGSMKNAERTSVVFGIITALPEEYAAVKALFDTCYVDKNEGEFGPGKSFVLGKIGEKLVALALLPRAGEEGAALYASNMKYRYTNLRYIFMVGIAGGVPAKTHLGDVVISTGGVIQLDYGKKTEKKFIVRNCGDETSIAIVEQVKRLMADSFYEKLDFEGYLNKIVFKCSNVFAKPEVDTEEYQEYDDESNGYVNKNRKVSKEVSVKLGVVGTGNSVLKDASLRDYYAKEYETIAFEMEAGGINQAAQFAEITYITIRGISDFCDNCKNDLWHNYAAANAAIFTYIVISRI